MTIMSSVVYLLASQGDAVASLLNSFDLPGGDVAALRKADEEYAAEMARIKEESAARLKVHACSLQRLCECMCLYSDTVFRLLFVIQAKEAELLASLMEFDAQMTETPVEGEDFASQLSDLESKASNAEKDLLEAMR